MEKLLTIVVPSYNTEKYMDSCLPTMLDERLTGRLEVLLVNDGSKDGTLAKARTYEARYPELLRVIDKPNGGHGSTINTGLAAASGRYFKVVDGDDWVDTEALVNLVEALDHCQDDQIISPHTHRYESGDTPLTVDFPQLAADKTYAYDRFLEKAGTLPMMHSVIFKTSLLQAHQIRLDEHMFYVDMEYITFPMPFIETARYLPLNLYQYRRGTEEQSVSLKNYIKNRDMHARVILAMAACWKELAKSRPAAYRTAVLKRWIQNSELRLHTKIYMAIADSQQAFAEFTRFKEAVDAVDPSLFAESQSRLVKAVRQGNRQAFKLAGLLVRLREGRR